MEQVWCPRGHAAPGGARFCPECAAPVSAQAAETQGGGGDSASQPLSPSGEGVALAQSAEQLPSPVPGSPHVPPLQEVSREATFSGGQALTAPSHTPAEGVTDLTRATTGALRGTRRKVITTALVLLLAAIAGAGSWFLLRETDEDRYLAALATGGFKGHYATPDVALAAGRSFCESLDGGAKTAGYDYQEVAVKELCPVYSESFDVVPTESQMAEEYTQLLREKNLGGKFASDATAVAHAQSVCRSLNEGADQQGPEVDAVGVSVFCEEYEAGFKTLYPISVRGTFTLMESDPSIYFPSIEGSNGDCYGSGGYSDISQGREVRITNSSRELLTTARLARGSGYPPVTCRFKFSFTVMDGESGGYMVEVGSRGSIHYSAAQLKVPASVALTLGD